MANRMFTVTSTLTTVRRASPAPAPEKGESVAMDVSNYPWLRTNQNKTFAVSMGRHEPPLPVRIKAKPGPKTEASTAEEKVTEEDAVAADAGTDADEVQEDNA